MSYGCAGGYQLSRNFRLRVQSIFSRENLVRWLLALGCFAVLIFFFSPSWGAFSLWSRVPEMSALIEVRRGASVIEQIGHPGAEIADPLHRAIQWRLLFPVIGHVLGLPPFAVFGLAYLGCLAVLGYIIALLRRTNAGWANAALATIVLGAASWFFVSTGWLGYFDSWLAFGLLIVAFARSWWAVWAACVWAPWVDERFVIALPLALICRWATATVASPGTKLDWKREAGISAALAGIFLVVRLGLVSSHSAANATLVGYFADKNYLDAPLGRIVLGVWEGLRSGWVLVVAAVALLKASPTRAAIVAVAVLLTLGAGLATAQDYSRSMTMVLPAAVLGAIMLFRAAPPLPRRILPVAAAAALVLPAHHVMNDRVNPIYYLYHELAAFDSPPAVAMPELHELRAIHEMEQGELAAAETDLTLAIKLARNPASPAKQRGVLYASAHRWDDAKKDFTMMVENEPDNPDGWFLRAQVELALKDVAAAKSDFDHARSIAPAGWTNRPDVTRFTAVFNQQTGQR